MARVCSGWSDRATCSANSSAADPHSSPNGTRWSRSASSGMPRTASAAPGAKRIPTMRLPSASGASCASVSGPATTVVTDCPSSRQMMSALPSGTTRSGGLPFGLPRRTHTAATWSRSSGCGLDSWYVTGSESRVRRDYASRTHRSRECSDAPVSTRPVRAPCGRVVPSDVSQDLSGCRAGGRAARQIPRSRVSTSLLPLRVVGEALPVDDDARVVPDYPCVMSGRDHREVAGTKLGLLTVIHDHLHPAGDVVTDVRGLATLGLGDRLDVLRPLPSGVERPPTDGPRVQVDHLDLSHSFFEGPGLFR